MQEKIAPVSTYAFVETPWTEIGSILEFKVVKAPMPIKKNFY